MHDFFCLSYFNKYNCKCGIIYVVRFELKTITCRTHESYSSYAVYTFALVLLRHFAVRHFPSFSSPANSSPANSAIPLTNREIFRSSSEKAPEVGFKRLLIGEFAITICSFLRLDWVLAW